MSTAQAITPQDLPEDPPSLDDAFPEFHGKIRFDAETKKGSVIDVIHLVTGSARHNCCRTLKTLKEIYPEINEGIAQAQINQKVISVIFSYIKNDINFK